MIAVVALVVIGPERLPGVARNVGRFTGRLQRYVSDIKRDFNREIEFDEIRRLQQEMETTVQSMQESMRVVESTLQQEVARHQSTPSDLVAAANATPVEEASALTKPRIRKKRDRQPEEPVKPTLAPQASADDDQYRLL